MDRRHPAARQPPKNPHRNPRQSASNLPQPLQRPAITIAVSKAKNREDVPKSNVVHPPIVCIAIKAVYSIEIPKPIGISSQYYGMYRDRILNL